MQSAAFQTGFLSGNSDNRVSSTASCRIFRIDRVTPAEKKTGNSVFPPFAFPPGQAIRDLSCSSKSSVALNDSKNAIDLIGSHRFSVSLHTSERLASKFEAQPLGERPRAVR